MDTPKKSNVLSTGLALFAMFFGAGNIVFPLLLGQFAGDKTFYAIMGLLVTAVAVPFAGLIAMMLFDGNYKEFFARVGKVPGYALILLILSLIGPVGCSRLITVSYATLKPYLHELPFAVFSFITCIVIFFCVIKKHKIMDLLGYVLTPFLLLSIFAIVVVGFISPPAPETTSHSEGGLFLHGLLVGYNTLDLVAAFLFSTMILVHFKHRGYDSSNPVSRKKLVKQMVFSSLIAAGLLSIIYLGLSYLASFYHLSLGTGNSGPDELLGALAFRVLGPYGGFIASIAVVLACLTTAISLVFIFSDFLQENVLRNKGGNLLPIVITLLMAFLLSNLGFMGIVTLIAPVLQVCYPALIVLSLVNIAHKLYGFKPVKTPVFLAFAASAVSFFI